MNWVYCMVNVSEEGQKNLSEQVVRRGLKMPPF